MFSLIAAVSTAGGLAVSQIILGINAGIAVYLAAKKAQSGNTVKRK